jgi:GntR family transcriptional regulator
MEAKLEKGGDRPYYVQLKDLLKAKIQSGELKGGRIPPIRQLAREYGVSVNTVLRAYEGLRREGIVCGTVGRGTFITTGPQELQRHNRRVLLAKVIEHALEEALGLEFSIEEFAAAVQDYVGEKMEMLQKVQLAFIECNIEQLLYFTDHLELDPHIRRRPILLGDLRSGREETLAEAAASDIIVTSFYHVNEVQERLAHLGRPIVGINLEPEVGTLIRIAKIPREAAVAIVTTSEDFRSIIREVLETLDLRFARVLETTSRGEEEVRGIVGACDAVLVSPQRRPQVAGLVREGTPVIEFVFTPDRTSINNLKVALLELQGRAPADRPGPAPTTRSKR